MIDLIRLCEIKQSCFLFQCQYRFRNGIIINNGIKLKIKMDLFLHNHPISQCKRKLAVTAYSYWWWNRQNLVFTHSNSPFLSVRRFNAVYASCAQLIVLQKFPSEYLRPVFVFCFYIRTLSHFAWQSWQKCHLLPITSNPISNIFLYLWFFHAVRYNPACLPVPRP